MAVHGVNSTQPTYIPFPCDDHSLTSHSHSPHLIIPPTNITCLCLDMIDIDSESLQYALTNASTFPYPHFTFPYLTLPYFTLFTSIVTCLCLDRIDIDNESLQCAMTNVAKNHFQPSAVTLRLVERCDVLQRALSEELGSASGLGLEPAEGKGTKRKKSTRPITAALLRLSKPATASTSSSSSSSSSHASMVCFDDEGRGPIRRSLIVDIDRGKNHCLHKGQDLDHGKEQGQAVTRDCCYQKDCVLACEEAFLRCSQQPTSLSPSSFSSSLQPSPPAPVSSLSEYIPSDATVPFVSAEPPVPVPVPVGLLYPPGCLYSAVMTNPPFYDTTVSTSVYPPRLDQSDLTLVFLTPPLLPPLPPLPPGDHLSFRSYRMHWYCRRDDHHGGRGGVCGSHDR